MMGALLGALGFVISGTALLAGFLVFISGLISDKPKTKKVGINAMMVAAIGLLLSFTLCSMSSGFTL